MRKVYFILGCTAGGKGAVGRAVARLTGGQIVSVDSMKVYRRMDIGTAKPSAAARREVPHHCIDLAEPSESFSAARFVEHADRAIESIHAAGAPVLAVGGTTLYIKALSEGLFAGPGADAQLRRQLAHRADTEGLSALHAELAAVDPVAAARIHPNDRRRIIRALEVFHVTGQPISELQKQWDAPTRRHDCVFLGLRRDKADQNRRINARARRMLDAGLRDEVAALLAEPAGLSLPAAQAVGYAEMIDHLQDKCSLDDAFERIKINTRRLAKKQRTWHRRLRDVTWLDITGRDDPAPIAQEVIHAAAIG